MQAITHSYSADISGIPIIALSDDDFATQMQKIQSYAVDIIRFYIETFGIYPHKYLVIVPGEDDLSGGHPVNSGVIAIHKEIYEEEPEEYWFRWITAHEIGHMYFGYFVKDKEKDPKDRELGWLTRGLGLYLDSLYMEEVVGYDKYHKDYLSMVESIEDQTKLSFYFPEDQRKELTFDYNEVVLHGRAFSIMKNLEKEIGRVEMISLLKKLLSDHPNEPIDFEDLLRVMQEIGMAAVELDVY